MSDRTTIADLYRATIAAAEQAARDAHARGQHSNALAFETTAASNRTLLASLEAGK